MSAREQFPAKGLNADNYVLLFKPDYDAAMDEIDGLRQENERLKVEVRRLTPPERDFGCVS